MSAPLAALRALLIDMDGVLWVGSRSLPGVAPFFEFLRAARIRFLLVTNNATRRAGYSVERMKELGVDVDVSQVLTAGGAAARWLTARHPEIRRVYVIGERALQDELREAGLDLVQHGADAVVVGLDRGLTYERLERATLEIRGGARFIATNGDKTLPTEKGLTPGAGAIVAAVRAATDIEPTVIGKPHRPLFDLALELLETPPEQTAMLGDRLDTDIEGAARSGLKTILVLTGVSTAEEAAQYTVKPDMIVPDLPALVRAWQDALD
jgi:4-nitrophenyl phosphatase